MDERVEQTRVELEKLLGKHFCFCLMMGGPDPDESGRANGKKVAREIHRVLAEAGIDPELVVCAVEAALWYKKDRHIPVRDPEGYLDLDRLQPFGCEWLTISELLKLAQVVACVSDLSSKE